MVGRVGIVGDYRVDFVVVALHEHGKVFPQTFLNVLSFFFPYKPIFLVPSNEFEQCRFFLVVQSLKGLYFPSKFCLVHGVGGRFGSA